MLLGCNTNFKYISYVGRQCTGSAHRGAKFFFQKFRTKLWQHNGIFYLKKKKKSSFPLQPILLIFSVQKTNNTFFLKKTLSGYIKKLHPDIACLFSISSAFHGSIYHNLQLENHTEARDHTALLARSPLKTEKYRGARHSNCFSEVSQHQFHPKRDTITTNNSICY